MFCSARLQRRLNNDVRSLQLRSHDQENVVIIFEDFLECEITWNHHIFWATFSAMDRTAAPKMFKALDQKGSIELKHRSKTRPSSIELANVGMVQLFQDLTSIYIYIYMIIYVYGSERFSEGHPQLWWKMDEHRWTMGDVQGYGVFFRKQVPTSTARSGHGKISKLYLNYFIFNSFKIIKHIQTCSIYSIGHHLFIKKGKQLFQAI